MSGDLLNRIREAESQVALPDKPVERPSIGSVVAKAISIALAVQGVQSAVGVVGGAVGGDAFSIITMAVLLGSVVAMVAKKKLEQRYPPKKLREIPGVDTARLFERAVAASKVTRIEKVRSLLSKTADDAVFWPTSVAALVTAFMATAAAFSSVAAAVASGAIGASIALSIMAFLGAKATISLGPQFVGRHSTGRSARSDLPLRSSRTLQKRRFPPFWGAEMVRVALGPREGLPEPLGPPEGHLRGLLRQHLEHLLRVVPFRA